MEFNPIDLPLAAPLLFGAALGWRCGFLLEFLDLAAWRVSCPANALNKRWRESRQGWGNARIENARKGPTLAALFSLPCQDFATFLFQQTCGTGH